MKIKIKNFNGELPSYLTEGKVYEGEPSFNGITFINDQGEETYAHLPDSAHLNGGEWEIVE